LVRNMRSFVRTLTGGMSVEARNSVAIRVFLISAHRCILWGFERLVESAQPTMQVVGSAASCSEAFERLGAVTADLILFDIGVGRADGIAAIANLKARSSAKILVLTGLRDETVHDDAVFAGASGVVRKESPAETILAAIGKVHAGELWLDRATTARIFGQISQISLGRPQDEEKAKIASLTAREREVIAFAANHPGATGETLAQMLKISQSTLRNHFTSIYNKLAVSNRLGLCAYAYKHELTLMVRTPQKERSHSATVAANRINGDSSLSTEASDNEATVEPLAALRSGNG